MKMFWVLFKMMACLVMLPFKLMGKMIKLLAVVLLPIMIMRAIMHSRHR